MARFELVRSRPLVALVLLAAALSGRTAPVEARTDASIVHDGEVRQLAYRAAALREDPGDATLQRVLAARAERGKIKHARGFRHVENPQTLITVDLWNSLSATEETPHLLDGSEAEKGLAKLLAPAPTSYFREVRRRRYAKTTPGHLEVVIFRPRAGQTRAGHVRLFDDAEIGFKKATGLVEHSLWIAPDGHWAHLVEWESEAAFLAGSKALMGHPEVVTWIRSLDVQRFKMARGEVLSPSGD